MRERQCPERKYHHCSRTRHFQDECWRGRETVRGQRGQKKSSRDRILPVEECRGEESVTIRIKVAGQELLAMLDTGATPSVIDRGTIDHLGLTEHVVLRQSRVFGLCKRPVEVQGVIQIHVTVGEQHIQTEFQVLDCDESILLLGRKFMSKFGLVSFDWKGGRNLTTSRGIRH